MNKGTVQNKNKFLNHIASRLGRERKTEVQVPDWKHTPQWDVYQDKTLDELYHHFKENSEEKGTSIFETTMDYLTDTVEDIIKRYDGKPIIATNDNRFKEYGLTEVLYKNEVHLWDPASEEINIEIAKQSNIGFFFSDVSLAESGTVTQFNNRDIARSVSLLPLVYVAIIPKSSIVPRMTQVTEKIHKQVKGGKNISSYINFITGPSNSADIEMNIVVGVHGPVKAAHVVIMDA